MVGKIGVQTLLAWDDSIYDVMIVDTYRYTNTVFSLFFKNALEEVNNYK